MNKDLKDNIKDHQCNGHKLEQTLGDGEMPGVLQSMGSQRGGHDWATQQQEEEKINESKKWFFEKINKIDKPSSGLTKNKGENSNKIRNERGDNIIYTTEIQKIIKTTMKNYTPKWAYPMAQW